MVPLSRTFLRRHVYKGWIHPKYTFKLPYLHGLRVGSLIHHQVQLNALMQLLCGFVCLKGLLQVTTTSFMLVFIFSAAFTDSTSPCLRLSSEPRLKHHLETGPWFIPQICQGIWFTFIGQINHNIFLQKKIGLGANILTYFSIDIYIYVHVCLGSPILEARGVLNWVIFGWFTGLKPNLPPTIFFIVYRQQLRVLQDHVMWLLPERTILRRSLCLGYSACQVSWAL